MNFALGLAFFIILFLLVFLLTALIAIFVYKDAKKRGLNPFLWAFIAVIAPSFIGLIIYLVIRGEHSIKCCPKCGNNVEAVYTVCPNCGQSLRNNCPNCGRFLEPMWNVCPDCAASIPENLKVNNVAQPAKDKSLRKIVVLIVIIPILIVALFCTVFFTILFSETDNSADLVSLNSVEYQIDDNMRVHCSDFNFDKWRSECISNKEGVNILICHEGVDSDAVTKAIVYCPFEPYEISYNKTHNDGITLDLTAIDGTDRQDTLCYFEFYSDMPVNIDEVNVDDLNPTISITQVSDIIVEESFEICTDFT